MPDADNNTATQHVRASHHHGGAHNLREACHDHPCPDYIDRGMPFKNTRAQPRQALGHGAVPEVGTRNRIAQGQQDLGDAAHPDPTDTDEVNPLCLRKHLVRAAYPIADAPPAAHRA